SPNSTPAGGPGFILTISGSGFQQGATVHWNRTPLAATVNNAGQLTAQIGANLIASPGSASVTVQNGNIASSASVFSISSPQNSVNADVESIKSVLAEYAEAVSQKNLRKATALFPLMPKEFQNTLQDFGRDYSLQYTIEVTAPPVVRGDDATVGARTVTRTKSGRRVSDPVTKSVVFTLHRGGGQWTITGLR